MVDSFVEISETAANRNRQIACLAGAMRKLERRLAREGGTPELRARWEQRLEREKQNFHALCKKM